MSSSGFILLGRSLLDNPISKKPPYFRDIWTWLLLNASFIEANGLQRGELVTSSGEIMDALSWISKFGKKKTYSKNMVREVIRYLKNENMIAVSKFGRKIKIGIINYGMRQRYEFYLNNHSNPHDCQRCVLESDNRGALEETIMVDMDEKKDKYTTIDGFIKYNESSVTDENDSDIPHDGERGVLEKNIVVDKNEEIVGYSGENGLRINHDGENIPYIIKLKNNIPASPKNQKKEKKGSHGGGDETFLKKYGEGNFKMSKSEPISLRMAHYFWQRLCIEHPKNLKLKQAKIEAWVKPIRMMIEHDQRALKEMVEVFNFILEDEFWWKVILSTANFREHYDQIYEKMVGKKAVMKKESTAKRKYIDNDDIYKK